MFSKFVLLILFVSILNLNFAENEEEDDFEADMDGNLFDCQCKNKSSHKLNMTIFYESLCPDSIEFFKKQFKSTWKPFYSYVNITLIPYGKATQKQDEKGNWKFECQHGEDECFHNRIQACAIQLKKSRPLKLMGFISCYMSTKKQDKYGPKCAKKYNINFKQLQKCANSKKGDELLAKYGNITHNFRPNITWIPTIVFNDIYNGDDNKKAASNLTSLLCSKLKNKPKACK